MTYPKAYMSIKPNIENKFYPLVKSSQGICLDKTLQGYENPIVANTGLNKQNIY